MAPYQRDGNNFVYIAAAPALKDLSDTIANPTQSCEARYHLSERLRSATVTIERSVICFDRWDGDSPEQRERDLKALERRKTFDD